jgi:hypothetical protein
MHALAHCRGNVDQGIQRKPGDAPAQQIADARLRDGTVAGGFYLRPAFALDQRGNFVHQLRAHAQVGGLLRRVGQRVPHTGEAVNIGLLQWRSFSSWVNRVLAVSRSRLAVVGVFF